MPIPPHNPGRSQSVWFSPYLLAIGLSFALFQTSTPLSCKSGDTTLSELAIIVSGQNQITFDKNQRRYDVWLPLNTNTGLVRAFSTDPKAQVWVDVLIGSERLRIMNGVVGGGEVSIPLQPALNTLNVWVRAPKGLSDYYAAGIRVGCSDCTDGNECTADNCIPLVQTCTHPVSADGASCNFNGGPGMCSAGVCSAVNARAFVVETIGGGEASSANHQISVSIGGPVGGGTASSPNHRIELDLTNGL